MSIEARLSELGITLPEPFRGPAGARYPFSWVRVSGNRAYVSGHLPLNADGSLTLTGKVGQELTLEQGAQAARLCGLAMLGSLHRELGSLDRIAAWLRVLGMVNVAPGFNQISGVVNGFSELLVQVFGAEVGTHARSAVGMAELPFSVPVEVEAEVEIRP
jgi:enamine deaminase RidA (YjgF/YER057c/UK114 family)